MAWHRRRRRAMISLEDFYGIVKEWCRCMGCNGQQVLLSHAEDASEFGWGNASSNQGTGRLDLARLVESTCSAQAGTGLGPEHCGGRGSTMARVPLEDLIRSRVGYQRAGIQLARWSLIHLVSRICGRYSSYLCIPNVYLLDLSVDECRARVAAY